jgi:hypothetical protein
MKEEVYNLLPEEIKLQLLKEYTKDYGFKHIDLKVLYERQMVENELPAFKKVFLPTIRLADLPKDVQNFVKSALKSTHNTTLSPSINKEHDKDV